MQYLANGGPFWFIVFIHYPIESLAVGEGPTKPSVKSRNHVAIIRSSRSSGPITQYNEPPHYLGYKPYRKTDPICQRNDNSQRSSTDHPALSTYLQCSSPNSPTIISFRCGICTIIQEGAMILRRDEEHQRLVMFPPESYATDPPFHHPGNYSEGKLHITFELR